MKEQQQDQFEYEICPCGVSAICVYSVRTIFTHTVWKDIEVFEYTDCVRLDVCEWRDVNV